MNNIKKFKSGDRVMWVPTNKKDKYPDTARVEVSSEYPLDGIYYGTILEVTTNDSYLMQFDTIKEKQYQYNSNLRHIEDMLIKLPIELV